MDSAGACSLGPACAVLTDRDVADLARGTTIVLDSWHLDDGAGIAVARHRARFTTSVAAAFGVAEDECGASYDHACGHLPRSGSWFPAFVWTPDGLRLVVRPFPVARLRRTTTLDATPVLDSRTRPEIKGINHLWQLGRRAAALAGGYDDQLLTTAVGLVSETVFATLVLVEGTELVVPDGPRLPSVTLSVLGDRAAALDLTVHERPVTVARLASADALLTLSALHGVRVVTRLGSVDLQPVSRIRDILQGQLETARRPLDGGVATCASC